MLNILEQVFGYKSFRKGQEQIVSNLISGKDVLAVMPTGAGKSICYQVPALKLDGITIVVSPLISLMVDQVRTLRQYGVKAAYFNSLLSPSNYYKALNLAKKYTYKIIYVAPERLNTETFLNFAKSVNISIVAIDEAHCISQWGHDFRPSYLNIIDFINQLPKRPIIGAFTATATDKVKKDIISSLSLNNPFTLTTGYNRENLYFSVLRNKDKKFELFKILNQNQNSSIIIYCNSRKNVDELTDILLFKKYKATKYHAGLEDSERNVNQEKFIQGDCNIMIATNAFGMGIDKPDVRVVVHYNMPLSMEGYYQEAGRAGRDGEKSECILLYNYQDYTTNKFLINLVKDNEDLTEEEKDDIIAKEMYKLDRIRSYCLTNRCLREYILKYFGEKSTSTCSSCGNCLGEITQDVKQFNNNKELFNKLKAITREIAKHERIPTYAVLNDSVLLNMSVKRPKTLEDMKSISGMGAFKIKKYGHIYLRIINE